MAFCTSCGANIADTATFCTSCGAKVTSPAAQTPGAAAQPAYPGSPQPKSGGGLKIVLLALGLLFGIIILVSAILGVVGWRIARHSRVVTTKDGARIETPFGKIESTENSEEVIRNLGVDVYPGAKATKGASVVKFGNMKTASAIFETSDSPDQVAEFYRGKFPDAMANVSDESGHSIVSSDKDHMVTIHIQAHSGVTRIEISNVSGMKNMPVPRTSTQ